jgi:hypothetical protein
MSKFIIYLGPSLPAQSAAALAPSATILPPATQGDLLRAEPGPGDTVLLIDGCFGSVPAIQHMEILELLERGVRVFGASSMGALRAVEMCTAGMVGLGWVFDLYRTGFVDGDDEVAVLHDPIDYTLYTVPLVNLRFAMAIAVERGTIEADFARRVVATAKAMPFGKRSVEDIAKTLSADGWSEDQVTAVRAAVEDPKNDVKRLDAVYSISALNQKIQGIEDLPKTIFRKRLGTRVRTENHRETRE